MTRQFFAGMVFSAAFLAGCGPEDVVLEEAAVNARVDSLVSLRMEEATRRAAEDLDRRQAIEVKVKTDSILDARARGGKPDTAKPAAGSEP